MPEEDLLTCALEQVRIIIAESAPKDRAPDEKALLAAQSELVEIGPRAFQFYQSEFYNAPTEFKINLVPVLGAIGGVGALAALRETLAAKGKTSLKDECAIALGFNADNAAIERLLEIAKRPEFPDRRARAIAALSRYKGNEDIAQTLVPLLYDNTTVILTQKVLSGIWPFRGLDWTVVEAEICDFAYAAIAEIGSVVSDYKYGDGEPARTEAIEGERKIIFRK